MMFHVVFSQYAWNSDGDVEAIELLMKFGASIRKPSKIGNIPLHRAFASPSAALMLLLVMTKEDRAMKNEDGRTPLAFAYFNLFGAQGGGRIQQAVRIPVVLIFQLRTQ